MARIIEVVDYDPAWIAAFEKEAAILHAIFGQRIVEVHDIGSTSVPGLDAKPIIDILIVLDNTDDINSFDHADYLRAHSHKAAAYGELKRRIAVQHRFDNLGYMRAKGL